MNNSDLKIAYDSYNKKYFGNKLPKDMVVHFAPCGDERNIGFTRFYRNRPLFIVIDKRIRKMKAIVLATLLHEMVHCELPKSNHGAPFQKRMLKLAKAGAFNKLW